VIGNGLPVQIELSPGQMNDAPMAELLLNDLPAGAEVIADKGTAPHTSRRDQTVTKKRKLIERFFNKLKQFRHIATRYDRSPLNYLAIIKTACVRLWLCLMNLRPNECDSLLLGSGPGVERMRLGLQKYNPPFTGCALPTLSVACY
jgi:transposase